MSCSEFYELQICQSFSSAAKFVDYVVQPQTIELPQSGNLNQQPTELRSIACGRGHTVIATDKISMYLLDTQNH